MLHAAQLNTRERLLQAAASLMWERSFQATGVDDLCKRAQAKKGSFYHFFPSKIDLAIAAIEKTWAQAQVAVFDPVFSRSGSGLVQFQHLIEKAYKYQTSIAPEKGVFLGCPFGNLGQEMAQQDERIRATLQKIFDAHCAYIEAALIRAEHAGEIPVGNNRLRAKNVFALLEGAQLLAKVANDPQLFRGVLPAVIAVASA